MRAAFWAVWLLAGCKTVHSVDVASHADAATAAQTETHEVKQAGPEIIALSVDEYAQLCPGPEKETAPTEAGAADRVSGSPAAVAARRGGAGTPTIAQGPLTRHIEALIYRGPSLDDLRTISSLQSKLNNSTEIKTKDESKPGGIFSLWFLVGLLPLVAGVLVWKLQPGLFGVAWGALKGLLK